MEKLVLRFIDLSLLHHLLASEHRGYDASRRGKNSIAQWAWQKKCIIGRLITDMCAIFFLFPFAITHRDSRKTSSFEWAKREK
jgi:hypothetical protein